MAKRRDPNSAHYIDNKEFLAKISEFREKRIEAEECGDPRPQVTNYLGECFVNGESLSVYMVRNGYAFDYTKYSKNKYRDDEEFARLNKIGMWSMEFEYPWDYKKIK